MSKPSRRPGREAIKQQRKARKKAQRELRQRQREEGFSVPVRPSLSNRTCPSDEARLKSSRAGDETRLAFCQHQFALCE
jgi:hypothetical protein